MLGIELGLDSALHQVVDRLGGDSGLDDELQVELVLNHGVGVIGRLEYLMEVEREALSGCCIFTI